MWDLPGSGIKLVCPELTGRFFTTEPPDKPVKVSLNPFIIKKKNPWIVHIFNDNVQYCVLKTAKHHWVKIKKTYWIGDLYYFYWLASSTLFSSKRSITEVQGVQSISPQNLPLWRKIILSWRQSRKSGYRNSSLSSPVCLKAEHKFPLWNQEVDNNFILWEKMAQRVYTNKLYKLALIVHFFPHIFTFSQLANPKSLNCFSFVLSPISPSLPCSFYSYIIQDSLLS